MVQPAGMLEVGSSMMARCPLAKPENNRRLEGGRGGCRIHFLGLCCPRGFSGSIHLEKSGCDEILVEQEACW